MKPKLFIRQGKKLRSEHFFYCRESFLILLSSIFSEKSIRYMSSIFRRSILHACNCLKRIQLLFSSRPYFEHFVDIKSFGPFNSNVVLSSDVQLPSFISLLFSLFLFSFGSDHQLMFLIVFDDKTQESWHLLRVSTERFIKAGLVTFQQLHGAWATVAMGNQVSLWNSQDKSHKSLPYHTMLSERSFVHGLWHQDRIGELMSSTPKCGRRSSPMSTSGAEGRSRTRPRCAGQPARSAGIEHGWWDESRACGKNAADRVRRKAGGGHERRAGPQGDEDRIRRAALPEIEKPDVTESNRSSSIERRRKRASWQRLTDWMRCGLFEGVDSHELCCFSTCWPPMWSIPICYWSVRPAMFYFVIASNQVVIQAVHRTDVNVPHNRAIGVYWTCITSSSFSVTNRHVCWIMVFPPIQNKVSMGKNCMHDEAQ
jgi:hypothetical protein